MPSQGKKYSNSEAFQKLMKYCAYQERCHQEVNMKLYDWGFYKDDRNEIIVRLIQENFINEERFARAYCRGRFRQKHWGKLKIAQGLKQKGVSSKLIEIAFEEISDDEYLNTLQTILIKKSKSVKETNEFKRNSKISYYAISRGFESALVFDQLKLIKF
ncbi:MAG: RecX family transcriptional regulator [Cytophagia bacterium]|nr:RecX family transcriptional regulator [Cytophagia bacterium]